jgi:PAS domain S-box-containing protein
MVDLCDEGRTDEALEIFYEDRGLTAWQRYSPFLQDANAYINELSSTEQKAYKGSIDKILVIQILLLVFLLPILTISFRKITKDNRFKTKIFQLIDSSNKNYLFNDGNENNDNDEIISNLISNLKKASNFINSITNGKYDINWEGMDNKTKELNKESIAGELISMRDQMLKAKQLDEIRLWTNEGLSTFADLIRKHQQNLHQLSEELISSIVEYLKAQQGGLFFVSEDDQNQKYLELMGCYAYQRKKFLEKRIEIGQGMVGQCFLEGETTYVTNIPPEYVNITSGLGMTNPKTLLIVPLKVNKEVVGVIEIASLNEFEKYQIEFLERLAETVASAISSVKINESTKLLLEQSQQQAEEMKAQEEEMRQNMEELQATQEQMHRKNEEVENLLKQASENEESMKLQMEALEELQEELNKNNELIKKEADDFRHMLMDILNEVPQKIFLKDAEGKMYIANQKVADAHGIPLEELIGKSDYDFVDKETADKWRKQELEIMKKGEEKYEFEDIIGGKKTMMESTKKVFYIRPINQKGLLGIQNDITEKVALKKKIELLEKK